MLYGYDRLHLGVAPALEQRLCYDIFVQLAFRLCMDSSPSLLLWQVLWRERRLLVTHFWHRLVGTAGAWFFWCASASAITAKATKANYQRVAHACSHVSRRLVFMLCTRVWSPHSSTV